MKRIIESAEELIEYMENSKQKTFNFITGERGMFKWHIALEKYCADNEIELLLSIETDQDKHFISKDTVILRKVYRYKAPKDKDIIFTVKSFLDSKPGKLHPDGGLLKSYRYYEI